MPIRASALKGVLPLVLLPAVLGACVAGPIAADAREADAERAEPVAERAVADTGEITVEGVYVTKASGVDCAAIRTEDGRTVNLHQVPPSIPLGARLRATGRMQPSLQCARVLRARSLERIDG